MAGHVIASFGGACYHCNQKNEVDADEVQRLDHAMAAFLCPSDGQAAHVRALRGRRAQAAHPLFGRLRAGRAAPRRLAGVYGGAVRALCRQHRRRHHFRAQKLAESGAADGRHRPRIYGQHPYAQAARKGGELLLRRRTEKDRALRLRERQRSPLRHRLMPLYGSARRGADGAAMGGYRLAEGDALRDEDLPRPLAGRAIRPAAGYAQNGVLQAQDPRAEAAFALSEGRQTAQPGQLRHQRQGRSRRFAALLPKDVRAAFRPRKYSAQGLPRPPPHLRDPRAGVRHGRQDAFRDPRASERGDHAQPVCAQPLGAQAGDDEQIGKVAVKSARRPCAAGASICHHYIIREEKPYAYCFNRCTVFFIFFAYMIHFITRWSPCQYLFSKKRKNFSLPCKTGVVFRRDRAAAPRAVCTSIKTIDVRTGERVQGRMSGEDQLIQIAIVSDDKKLAGALRALTGVCCASMGKLCRCALVSDLEAFAASLCPDMYAVVFSSFTGGEGDLFSLRKAAPRAGVILVSADITSAVSGYMIDCGRVFGPSRRV